MCLLGFRPQSLCKGLNPKLAKIDLRAVSNGWKLLERRDIIIRDIDELEVVQISSKDRTLELLLVLTLKYPEQMHLRGFGTFFSVENFRNNIRPGEGFLTELCCSHFYAGGDPIHDREAVTPTLTADQACFRHVKLLTMRFRWILKKSRANRTSGCGWIPRKRLRDQRMGMAWRIACM